MWCLKGREGFCVYILPNQKKSFGKQSDVKLEGDATVSRLHAVISVEPTEEAETQYKCVINDVSKYGTFVVRDKKKRKLPSDDKFILIAGDTVQFGLKDFTFVVLCHSFIIAKSSLDEQDVKKLKDIVHDLNATLSETWENSCTHLTVAKSTLFTTKLACALASAKPIVTNAYWEAVNIAIKESKALPEIEDFLPKVKEEWLNVCSRMFLPNEKRKTLFKGLSFVHFCGKQYFAFAPLITAAGGKSCVYPTKRPLTPRDLTAKNAIVIQQPANDSSQFTQAIAADYPIIYHKLQAVKRRMISDTEIPLAILHCNTETYCNPKYDFASFLKLEIPKVLSSNVIIENTQDIVTINTRQIKRKIIPETYESPNNETVSKRVRFFDETEGNISDVNESNIAKQNIDNRESKCKIIPETCDSQTSKKILRSSYSFYENESKCISGPNESSIAMNNEQKNIFNSNKSNTVNNILPNNANKHCQIIPDSCCSIEKNVSDIFSDVRNNFATEKKQNVKLQEKETFKENATFAKNNQERNMLQEIEYGFQQQKNSITNKENDTIFEKNNLDRQKNSIVENDNLNNNKFDKTIAKWENSKNTKTPHIISVKKINDCEIDIKQRKEKSLLEKDCSRIELQNSLNEQKLKPVCNTEKYQEDKRMKEDKIQTKNNKKQGLGKTEDNETYLGSMDKILRKDVPCGKKFKKMFVVKPEKILRMDDFIL